MSSVTQLDSDIELLRFTTAGSVDDGKSTLIGRLLFDSKGVYKDQLDAVKTDTHNESDEGIDLAALTDGLQAEREQGITIDVAYRYFATSKRKFIIADTPGHEQYTRNMVTGASTADTAIILIDARKGVRVQSRRHATIASLLGISNIIVAINKMDMVEYSEAVFDDIVKEFSVFCQDLGLQNVRFIPVSALKGDLVVHRGDNMNWYQGDTLLHTLETVPVDVETAAEFRFPVQLVSRPQTAEWHDFRGYMGRIESGSIRVNDEVTILPAGKHSRIKEIVTFDGNLQQAHASQSVTITLKDEIDISRGDILVDKQSSMHVAKEIVADVCWLDEQPLQLRGKYLIKHGTQTLKVSLNELQYRVNVNSLEKDDSAEVLNCNEIGRVLLRTQKPLAYDIYDDLRSTGSFIIIDEFTNNTVAAGMIRS